MRTLTIEPTQPPNRIVHKVLVYLVCRGRILTFEHCDYPEAGLQVPGGTVEEGESIVECAQRELFEESGLRSTAVPVVFNEYSFFPEWDEGVVHHRHLVSLFDDTIEPAGFAHTVTKGAEDKGLRLNFSWCDYATFVRNVGSGHELGTYVLQTSPTTF